MRVRVVIGANWCHKGVKPDIFGNSLCMKSKRLANHYLGKPTKNRSSVTTTTMNFLYLVLLAAMCELLVDKKPTERTLTRFADIKIGIATHA